MSVTCTFFARMMFAVAHTMTVPNSTEVPDRTPACIDIAVVEAHPAAVEWSYWTSGAASFDSRDAGSNPAAGLGADLTFGLLTYPGFPSGPYGALGRAELRGGPFVQMDMTGDGGLVEAGITLALGAVYHASFGTWTLRLGSGYGVRLNAGPHVGVTFAWGVRSVRARYSKRGHCDAPTQTKPSAEAAVARLFVTHRRTLREPASELLVGLELSPTFLLPPYTSFRLTGGPDW